MFHILINDMFHNFLINDEVIQVPKVALTDYYIPL